jgi:hypothetical protein
LFFEQLVAIKRAMSNVPRLVKVEQREAFTNIERIVTALATQVPDHAPQSLLDLRQAALNAATAWEFSKERDSQRDG